MFTMNVPVSVVENGKLKSVALHIGENLVKALKKQDVKIAAACEGNLGCGTCHVYFDEKTFKKLPQPTDDEENLLKFSPGLKRTSRLACGVTVDENLRGAVITIPQTNRNIVNEDDE